MGAAILAALSSATVAAFAADVPPPPLRVLLIAGGCCHDYATQKDLLKAGLEARARVTIDIVYSDDKTTKGTFDIFNNPDWAKDYDLVIHDECTADVTDAAYLSNILAPHIAGLPAVVLHCGMHSFRTEGWNQGAVTPWFEFTGLQTTGHGRQLPIALSFFDRDSEIISGMENWTTINEELYNNAAGGVLPTARGLVRGRQGDSETVVAWTNLYRRSARVFATTLGHNNATVSDPRYLDLVARGLLWAADRLNADYLIDVPATASVPVPASLPDDADCGCAVDLAQTDAGGNNL